MVWLACTIMAYGFELILVAIMMIALIGFIFPESRKSKFIGTVYRTLYFDDDEFEKDKAL